MKSVNFFQNNLSKVETKTGPEKLFRYDGYADIEYMNTTSILYIFITLSGLFFASSVLAKSNAIVEKGQYVLVERGGTTQYGQIGTSSKSKEGNIRYTVTFNGYNENNVATLGTGVYNKNQLVLPAKQITHSLQGELRTLTKGTVILGAGQKMYVIEDVFQNGQLAATPLVASLTSRNRVSEHFTRVRKANVEVLNKEDILAIEVDSFGKYKKGERKRKISSMPLCNVEAMKKYQLPLELRDKESVSFSCGRANQGALIHAVFSDGTLAIDSHVFNPFPQSRDKYMIPEVHSLETGSQE